MNYFEIKFSLRQLPNIQPQTKVNSENHVTREGWYIAFYITQF